MEKAANLNVAALHANCSNLRIQAIEEGIAGLEKEHSGSKIPVNSSDFLIFAEKNKLKCKEMAGEQEKLHVVESGFSLRTYQRVLSVSH